MMMMMMMWRASSDLVRSEARATGTVDRRGYAEVRELCRRPTLHQQRRRCDA